MKTEDFINLIKKSGNIFDQHWYVQTYPDVGLLGMDPAAHFIRFGSLMSRNPSPSFNTEFYRQTYLPDANGPEDPLLHYLLVGRAKGYLTKPVAVDESAGLAQIGAKLFQLGFTTRPLAELGEIAQTGSTAEVRAKAEILIVRWHLTSCATDTALEGLQRIAAEELSVATRADLATLHLLALTRSGDVASATSVYHQAALSGAASPEVMLAYSNSQPHTALRLVFINQALKKFGLAPLSLDPAAGGQPFDRLKAAAPAPRVEAGVEAGVVGGAGTKVSVFLDLRASDAGCLVTLGSLQAQSWQALEVVVICGPESESGTMLSGLSGKISDFEGAFGDLRVVTAAGDTALAEIAAQTNGTYCISVAPGTWLHPSALELQARALDADSGLSACTVQSLHCDENLDFTLHRDGGILLAEEPALSMWRRAHSGPDNIGHLRTGPAALVLISAPDPMRKPMVQPVVCDIAVIADLRAGSPEVDAAMAMVAYAAKNAQHLVFVNAVNYEYDSPSTGVHPAVQAACRSGDATLAGTGAVIEARLTLAADPRRALPEQGGASAFHDGQGTSGVPAGVKNLASFIATTDFKLATSEQRARSGPTHHVGSLRNWLWGGFSQYAQEQIDAVVKSTAYSKSERAAAAYSLARWYAHLGRWQDAHNVLVALNRIDIRMYRNKKCKLLQVETFIHLGEFEKAMTMIKFVLDDRIDGDFTCALNNLLLAMGDTEARAQRSEAVNAAFKDAGLLPIQFPEGSGDLKFGQWSCQPASGNMIHDGPKVSVLMPVYKAEDFIEISVRSILAQTWRNIEIIAVEDCGPDNSWEKLQELASQDDRIKIFRNERNLGAYPTRNRALSLATGEFITVHDSDDWSHPQMIEVQMRAMQEKPELKATFSRMTRVNDDLTFMLRPQRENLEYVHRSYPSLLIRRSDVDVLGEWDSVSANADDEFVQRIRLAWGEDALEDILPNVPLSFFLVHEESLTQQKGTSLNSLTFGIRQEYSRQAKYWRRKIEAAGGVVKYERTSMKAPFPIPAGLAPKNWPKDPRYDLVLISDLSLLGGTRRCNEGYIRAAVAMGLRVGLFHWPRFDLRPVDIADEYMDLSYHPLVDFLVPEDEISAGLVLIHHPPILKYRIDGVPKIDTDKVAILVNQSPMQLFSEAPYYYDGPSAEAICRDHFGVDPIWLSIAPRVTKILEHVGGYSRIAEDIWYPPYSADLPDKMPALPPGLGTDRPLVLGRHARDHWTKWPEDRTRLSQAYCAGADDIQVRLLGGIDTPLKVLETLPSNWQDIPFDSVNVSDFVRELDFFVHFVHSDYIEEFGRNIMEAMAAGRVVLLPIDFEDTFGDAAIYCEPKDVATMMRRLWTDPDAYRAQAQRGFDFVQRSCTLEKVQDRLRALIGKAADGGKVAEAG